MSRLHYECFVIGGGSAGYAAARTAAGFGLRVAVADGAEDLGGLCILRGCMPSKTLLESANRLHSARRAREFGLRAENLAAFPEEIQARKRALVGEFADYRAEQLRKGRFELLRARASFLSQHEVLLRYPDGRESICSADTIILSTGSRVAIPPIPGLREPGILTSDSILEADTLPESLIVLGGGAIALELAWYHHALGVPTTVIQRSPHLMRSMDADVADALAEAFRAGGMEILTGTRLHSVESSASGLYKIGFEWNGGAATREAARVLCALGREPATEALSLELAGLDVREGRVETDIWQTTSQPHIFAAGDVCGPHDVVHLAIAQGEAAAANAAVFLGRQPESMRRAMDYRLKLFALFTHPEAASVGMTESEAKESGLPCLSATYPFADHGKSMVMGETAGFVKLLADARDGRILGGAVVGPLASELIHEIVVAMAFRATVLQLASIPHYHPTLSEIWTYPAEELAERVGLASA